MNDHNSDPPLHLNSPSDSRYTKSVSPTTRSVTFSLDSSSPVTTPEYPGSNTFSEFAVVHELSKNNWLDDTKRDQRSSDIISRSHSNQGASSVPSFYSPYSTPPNFTTSYLRYPAKSEINSWEDQYFQIESPRYRMIVEEKPMATSDDQQGIYKPAMSRSIANSLDSLSECAQNTCEALPGHVDRSQSLGDLYLESARSLGSAKIGSFDTLISKTLTDSGISGGLVKDGNSSTDRLHTVDGFSPDPYTYQTVSFPPYDPNNFSNENVNPLDANSRIQFEDRKQLELPVISEESDHEHNLSLSQQSSVDREEVVELSYPMTHCNSEPSNAYSKSAIGRHYEHRRVVSDDVSEVTRLKRSNEIENVNKIGNFECDAKTPGLKKGRCKSLMLVVQGDGEDEPSSEEDEGLAGDSKDNDMLIIPKNSDLMSRKNNFEQGSAPSSEPPPVRISRKASATSTKSTPSKSASEQSWKDKMPPFAMSSHMMYSPQSLPSRDVLPRSPFDGAGTISGGTQSSQSLADPVGTMDEFEAPDGFYRVARCSIEMTPPEVPPNYDVELQPLSSIFRRRVSMSSTTTEVTNHSPQSSPSINNNNTSSNNNNNNSFVRRSLRKIMKRSSASASAINEQYDGPRTNSLKRRASAASSSLIASAQAHLRPRAKSLKKQRLSKPNKKEKSGSDTFTFGNLFRKKQQPNRANLQDIISDLDQRSVTKQNSFNGSRRCTSASIVAPMSEAGTYETSPLEGLPDHISRMVSPADSSDSLSNMVSPSSSLQSQLDRLWGKYGLFDEDEYQSWHEKYRYNTLSSKQIKKQDAMYELYMMEKRHCASIAFLLQGYRRRMIEECIISKQEMDILIPDVLEPLLIFHLNVLERITERMKESIEVSTISDIICNELDTEGGRHTKLCCDAYTDFGVSKEKSDTLYHHLMNKSPRFAEFLKKSYNEDPLYKQFEFRPLVTKIIGRPTKYSLLLETILKNEQQFTEHYDWTKKALETARRFAHKIDENLSIAHMSSKWDEVKAQIDPSSQTSLYVPDAVMQHSFVRHRFDLDTINAVPNRKLVYIGEVFFKQPLIPSVMTAPSTTSSSSGKMDKTPGYLILFDDIIVILLKRGNRLHFMQEQGALPVKTLLTRTSARGHSIMLISGGKPILLEITFHSSGERKKWVTHLEAGPRNVPLEFVRLPQSKEESMLRMKTARQTEVENQWLDDLEHMFESRFPEEEALCNYLETRLKFFDDIRAHMGHMPFKNRHDIPVRIREAVRGRFRELRRRRVYPLNRLVDRMTEARDADLFSFFDDKADASDIFEKSSDLSDESSCSEESNVGTSRSKPRRIQTFHGVSQNEVASGSELKSGIRRHTTVPRLSSDSIPTSETRTTTENGGEDEKDEVPEGKLSYQEMIAELPLRQSARARTASTRIIKEVITLRRDNNLLRSENAMAKSRCALLERSRGAGIVIGPAASAVDESMEMLRKKEKEIREIQRQMMIEKEDLAEKQASIEKQELEIQSKWNALQQRSNEPTAPSHTRTSSSNSAVSSPTYRTAPQSSPNIEWSPVLANLATKTETKRKK